MSERGATALPAALATLAVAVALTGAVADLARTEVMLARYRLTTAAALGAADACLARVVAALPVGWEVDGVLAGPDAVAGTPDDGLVPAPAGCAVRAQAAPGPPLPWRVVLEVAADARGGHRALAAVVGRARPPGAGTLLWLAAPPVRGAVAGRLVLEGADADDPSLPAAAGFAAPAEPEALDAWAAGEAGLAASAATGSPVAAPPPSLAALAARLAGVGPVGAAVLVPAGPAPLALAYVAGDLAVAGTLAGAGLLFVDGTLDIQGRLDFKGLVVATGGVRVRPGAVFTLEGSGWLAGDPARQLVVEGEMQVRHAHTALDAVDQRLPLPRRAAVLGLRDLG